MGRWAMLDATALRAALAPYYPMLESSRQETQP